MLVACSREVAPVVTERKQAQSNNQFELYSYEGDVARNIEIGNQRKLAQQGDVAAMVECGKLLSTPAMPPHSRAEAREWLMEAVEAGSTEAWRVMAESYMWDRPRSELLYYQCLSIAAEWGDDKAARDLDSACVLGYSGHGDRESALLRLHQRSALGDRDARMALSWFYSGDELPAWRKDEALSWLRHYAAESDGSACLGLFTVCSAMESIEARREAIHALQLGTLSNEPDSFFQMLIHMYQTDNDLCDPEALARWNQFWAWDRWARGLEPPSIAEYIQTTYTPELEEWEYFARLDGIEYSPDAMFAIGDMQYRQRVVEGRRDEGMQLMLKAAARGNPPAIRTIDWYLQYGIDPTLSPYTRMKWAEYCDIPFEYSPAIPPVALGNPHRLSTSITSFDAKFDPGFAFLAGIDHLNKLSVKELHESIRLFEIATKQDSLKTGHAELALAMAWQKLGELHLYGQGTSVDSKLAASCFEKAASHGSTDAPYYLGYLAAGGNGGTPDWKSARTWFEKCQGEWRPRAEFALSQIYLYGYGVPADRAMGATYLYYSAAANYPPAMILWNELVKRDPTAMGAQEIIKSLTQGATAGPLPVFPAMDSWISPEVYMLMARQYGSGGFLSGDTFQEHKWLRKAAEQLDGEAMVLLASKYLAGREVHRDEVEAREWLDVAANRGSARALEMLGAL